MPEDNATSLDINPPPVVDLSVDPPVVDPPVVDDAPPTWDFSRYQPPPADPPATPAFNPVAPPDADDAYAQAITQQASQQAALGAFGAMTQIQQNYMALRQELASKGASDDVITFAEGEFWKLGLSAADPRAVPLAAKLAFGEAVSQGKAVLRPKPVPTPPGGSPVGHPNPASVQDSETERLNKLFGDWGWEFAADGSFKAGGKEYR
jgi:hypothetical protein